jgi:hypothetical protein
MDPWAIVGALAGVVALPIAGVSLWMPVRRPRVYFGGGGILTRCLTAPAFRDGWGIFTVSGTLRVSHRAVTVVNAELSYRMPWQHVRPSAKYMDAGFPPLVTFPRVADDEQATIPALGRRDFNTVALTPGGGERQVKVNFALGGNFAEVYSDDFFSHTLSSDGGMFIPMLVRFQFDDNGRLRWTKNFPVRVAPFYNQGWTPDGPQWIDANGAMQDVRHGPPVDNRGETP